MRHLYLWATLAGPVLGGCEYLCECDDCSSDPDTSVPDDEGDDLEYLEYRYVRIDDLSDDEREGTPGAEIDAVARSTAAG